MISVSHLNHDWFHWFVSNNVCNLGDGLWLMSLHVILNYHQTPDWTIYFMIIYLDSSRGCKGLNVESHKYNARVEVRRELLKIVQISVYHRMFNDSHHCFRYQSIYWHQALLLLSRRVAGHLSHWSNSSSTTRSIRNSNFWQINESGLHESGLHVISFTCIM